MSININARGYLEIENARIFAKNFSGNKFGKGGAKGFCVWIDDSEWAEKLFNDGWNIKSKTNQDDPDDIRYFLPVALAWNDRFQPNVKIFNGHKLIRATENAVPLLDNAYVESTDLVIRGRNLENVNGCTKKAYAHTMYVTIESDPFADKYAAYDENIDDKNSDDVPF